LKCITNGESLPQILSIDVCGKCSHFDSRFPESLVQASSQQNMDSKQPEMPMKPEVRENEDERSTTVSEQVQVNTGLDIPPLSNNLQLTMAAVTELKLPLQELLDIFSRAKKSVQTIMDALDITEGLLRSKMSPPEFFQYLYQTLDMAFTLYEDRHPDFEWRGKLVKRDKHEWSRYRLEEWTFPEIKQGVSFGIPEREPATYQGRICFHPGQRLEKLAFYDKDEYFYGTEIGRIENFLGGDSREDHVSLYFGVDRKLHWGSGWGLFGNDSEYHVDRVNASWDLRELRADKVFESPHD